MDVRGNLVVVVACINSYLVLEFGMNELDYMQGYREEYGRKMMMGWDSVH